MLTHSYIFIKFGQPYPSLGVDAQPYLHPKTSTKNFNRHFLQPIFSPGALRYPRGKRVTMVL